MKYMKKLLLLVASLIVMWANSAGATLIVINPPARVPDISPGVFDWTYAAVLQPGTSMRPGDFFTIYDFPNANLLSTPLFGTTSGSDKASFTVSVQNTGRTPLDTSPQDKANVSNVTVTLVDGNTDTPGFDELAAVGGVLQLGTLIVRSNTRQIAPSLFGSALHFGPGSDNVSTIGDVQVAVPEPGSITLLIAGLLACGAVSFRRRVLG